MLLAKLAVEFASLLYCPAVYCGVLHEVQSASGLLTVFCLVVFDWVVFMFARFIYDRFKERFDLVNKYGTQEFDIPRNVLDIVYSQSLSW